MGARDRSAGGTHSRRRRGRSNGQAVVEFALVLTFGLLVAFFGTIEFVLFMSSVGSYDFAVREAARVGSVVGRTNPNVDQSIINAVSSRVTGLVAAQMTEVDIYDADPFNGKCYNASSAEPGLTVDDPACQKDQYFFNGSGPLHTLCTGPGTGLYCAWPPDLRDDSLADADYLGVRVLYQYTFITAFINSLGAVVNLSTYSVQRIEPQDYQGSYVSPPMASHFSGAAQPALAAALPVWKQEDEGGIG